MHGTGSPLHGGSKRFLAWEEAFVSNDRGSRVVHLYLKDAQGQRTLAVVGTERSRRHMVYMVCDEFLPLVGLDKSTTWRSRREVVDWLSSLLSKSGSGSSSPCRSDSHFSGSPPLSDAGAEDPDEQHQKQIHSRKCSQDVFWVGPGSTCRKRLKHYKSFRRNGITISVKSFVFVMSEEKEHHIAYIEDMYEDKKSRKKLRVRWFHKTKELTCKIPLPAPHPREVFFTQFPQVISVECVDGLATVLAPEHFEKCPSVFQPDTLELIHVCSRQFDGEGVKPLNICEVEGYWFQNALVPIGVSPARGSSDLGSYEDEDEEEAWDLRPTRYCRGKKLKGHSISPSATTDTEGNGGLSDVDPSKAFDIGDKVELLCQDSGLRGCWFTGRVINRINRRVQVRYDDLKDEDGKENLEEWVSTSKFAPSDKLSMHAHKRPTVRPSPPASSSPVVCSFGSPVDVWWNDGWWEGVVITRCVVGSEIRVYFPDEGDTASFKVSDVRTSRDWVNGQWSSLKTNPEIVSALGFGVVCGSKTSLQNCRYVLQNRQFVDGMEPAADNNYSNNSSSSTEQDELDKQLSMIAEAAEAGLKQLKQDEDNVEKLMKKAGKKRGGGEVCFDSCKHSKEVNAEEGPGWRNAEASNSSKKARIGSSNSSIHFGGSLPPLVLSR